MTDATDPPPAAEDPRDHADDPDPWGVTEDDGTIGAAAWMTAALDDLDPAVGE